MSRVIETAGGTLRCFPVTYLYRNRQSSGAEKHGFAVEHLYRDKDSRASVKAGGEKDQGYGVPVVSAGNQIFAEQTYVENRYQRQPWSELYSWKHGRDGRNDDHNHERR